ncbi:MAG: nicotinate (nicotinamide) nucleotide adenylyltransferase [Deltaproteobacteria bacterium GWC2_42_11]|nr:MAG: nicotinate (nicotinamide) nucleotide adenylyltransferase [Deltaproteobacteria bacterium GWC2_42_11]HBO84517.1 nicotinate-nicotinamide nucleotide adenylyltransferase [Deltaproteobacteria bacterium]
MHTAIMGGTFNPIHLGHLRIAEEVKEYLDISLLNACRDIDKIIFIPSYLPPHKEDGSLISPNHRLEMVKLAVRDNPDFQASDVEIKRGGTSYSVKTLETLREEMPDTEISFIVGTDSFNEITIWCEYERLFELTNFIVVTRPGYPVKKIDEILPDRMACKFGYDAARNVYVHDNGKTVTYMATTLIDISASDIRKRVREGRSVRYLVPHDVEQYIMENRLYK